MEMRRSVIWRPNLSCSVIFGDRELDAAGSRGGSYLLSWAKEKARSGEWNRALAENIRIFGDPLLSKTREARAFPPEPSALSERRERRPASLGMSPHQAGGIGVTLGSVCLCEKVCNSVESRRSDRTQNGALPVLFL